MATQMKVDDEIRLNIMEALLQKRSVVPNIKQIQKETGYHKATIKSSIDFLKKKGLLAGFGPKFNFRHLGYGLEAIEMIQADLTEKEIFDKFVKASEKDPHLYRLSPIVGHGNFNLMARHMYKDIESYHQGTQQNYFEKVPEIYKLIKDRLIFYATEPFYKNLSRTEAAIQIIRKEKGLE